jgi:hypothetical protein
MDVWQEHSTAVLQAADEIERLRNVLNIIAGQRLAEEMPEDVRNDADYEGAYDCIVRDARAALAKPSPDIPSKSGDVIAAACRLCGKPVEPGQQWHDECADTENQRIAAQS